MIQQLRIFHQADQGGQPGQSGESKLTEQQLLYLLAPIPRDKGMCQDVIFGSPDDETHISTCSTGTPEEDELIKKIVEQLSEESPQPKEPR